MQTNSFLQSFDKKVNKQIDLTVELARLQAEQQIIFDKKLKDAEKKAYDKITKELEQKYATDLTQAKSQALVHFTQEIKRLTENFSQNIDIHTKNCVKIIEIFLNHHLKTLNKHIINQQVIDTLCRLLNDNQHHKLSLSAHDNTMTEVKAILDVKLFPVEYKTDDTMLEGDVHINFDGGGVHFSRDNIMRHITDICNELTQHYFIPYPEEQTQ